MPDVPPPDPILLARGRALRAESTRLRAAADSLRHRSRFLHSRVRWVSGRSNDLLTITVFQHRPVDILARPDPHTSA
jgi:hypothetical protein